MRTISMTLKNLCRLSPAAEPCFDDGSNALLKFDSPRK